MSEDRTAERILAEGLRRRAQQLREQGLDERARRLERAAEDIERGEAKKL